MPRMGSKGDDRPQSERCKPRLCDLKSRRTGWLTCRRGLVPEESQPRDGAGRRSKHGRICARPGRFRARSSGRAAPIVLVLAFGKSLAFISLLIPAWGALVAIGALDRRQRHQLLAGLDRRRDRRGARRLALLLVRLQIQGTGRPDMAAVALSGDPAARRGLREKMGRTQRFSSAGFSDRCAPRCRLPQEYSRCRTGGSRSPISFLRWSGRRRCCCSATSSGRSSNGCGGGCDTGSKSSVHLDENRDRPYARP